MMRFSAFFFLLLAVTSVISCRTAELSQVPTEMRDFRDGLGRTVRVPAKVDRVISLAPNLTEMIFAVGAGDRLVGVTTYCNHPATAAAIEKVGDTQTPNIERIIALKPQLVFVSTASQLEAFSKTLDEQGIGVYVDSSATLESVFETMQEIGAILGTPKVAIDLTTRLSNRVDSVDIRGQVWLENNKIRPKVFIQISNEPLFTIGKESFLTSLVEKAGGISTTRDVPAGYPKLSKETAAALDPDVIFLSDSEDNREPNSVFKSSNAVRKGRVYRINADILSRPGPRLVDALEQIAEKLRETS